MVHRREANPQGEELADLNAPKQKERPLPGCLCTYMYVAALYTPSHIGQGRPHRIVLLGGWRCEQQIYTRLLRATQGRLTPTRLPF